MAKKNLLHSINLPIKKIIDTINWFNKTAHDMLQKYIKAYPVLDYNDYRFRYAEFDGVETITASVEGLYEVEGHYNTTSKAVGYTPTSPNDEGWRVETGNFKENEHCTIFSTLFTDSRQATVAKLHQHFYDGIVQKKKDEAASRKAELDRLQKKVDTINNLVIKKLG